MVRRHSKYWLNLAFPETLAGADPQFISIPAFLRFLRPSLHSSAFFSLFWILRGFFFIYISALGDDTTLPPLSVKAAFFSGNHTLPLEPSSFLCVLYPVVSRDEVARESELINILAVAMKLCCNIYTHTSTTTARCLRTIHVDYNSTSLCFACCTGLKK